MALTDLPNNPMNFTENQHGNVILDKLKIQKDQARFCDVTLYVKDQQFRAHRNVLATCSPYFDSIFKTHRVVKERLTITCQNSEIFQCLLNYMYTGSIVIDKSNVGELLRLANHFLIHKLKGYCAEYMDRYLDLTNCLSVREMAEKFNMPVLSKAATIFIQIHLNKVVHQEEVLTFQFQRFEAFLSNKSWSVAPSLLLPLITRWIMRDAAHRQRYLRALLVYVDWSALDASTISEHLDRDGLYAASDAALFVTLQALVENNMLFPKYQGVYQSLQDKCQQIGFAAPDGLDLNDGMRNDVSAHRLDKDEIRSDHKAGKTCRRVLSSGRRRRKLTLMRPAARLAALKSALASRLAKTSGSTVVEDPDCVRCTYCDHLASDPTQLEHHLASVHNKEVTYRCSACGFLCRWNRDYLAHMRGHFPGPPFHCDLCELTASGLSELLTHRAEHAGEKSQGCTECSFRCRSRTALATHMTLHSNELKCLTCGRIFSNKPALDHHASTAHLGPDRTHACDICAFTTKYASHLSAHKRLHSGEVYRCSHQQCKFSAARKSQMVAHSRTHAAARPHHCTTCGRGFLEKSHLVRHERIHLEEKPFKCVECEYASSRRDKLKEHFVRHHGEHASAKVAYKARPTRPKTAKAPSPAHFPGPAPVVGVAEQHMVGYPGFAPDQAPPPGDYQLRPPTANRAHNNLAAAMMLDPRFHHPNAGNAYHGMGQQHQDYPCMPLF